jgi:calcineurin-like phosphoesterase family protein
MSRIFVVADHHLGHGNIIKFTKDNGEVARPHPLENRPFKNIHEHDELLIRLHNEIVTPEDHVYFLGDVVISKQLLPLVTRMMGKKRLVRGNHDICDTKLYIDVGFKEIYGVRVFHREGFILSHYPLHPKSIKKGWINVHGHTHSNIVRLENGLPDERYRCVSVEHTGCKPIFLLETKSEQ